MASLMEMVTSSCPHSAQGFSGAVFSNTLQALLAAQCALVDPERWPKDASEEIFAQESPTFDFIVVGAGSAGSVVANRLSKNENWKVLLIESGGDPTLDSEIPAFLFQTHGTDIDWGYQASRNSNYGKAYTNEQFPYNRGKVLGGSSTINAMLYVRGNKRDYDNWEAQGNEGWNYEQILKYFKKSENHKLEEGDDVNDEVKKYHGVGGELNVEQLDNVSKWKEILKTAWNEMGYSFVDHNGPSQIGISFSDLTVKDGQRVSAAKAFLSPIKSRKNLYVMKHTLATKILINSNRQAYGVRIRRSNSEEIDVVATKEVVLSAGVFNTAQLLMLSGVGPKSHLEELGIDVVVDLQVGRNLQDHVVAPVHFLVEKQADKTISNEEFLQIITRYLITRKGHLNSIGITDVLCFIDTLNGSDYPDIQYHHVGLMKKDQFLLPHYAKSVQYNPEVVQFTNLLNENNEIIQIYPTLLRPKSRGRVELKSKNPEDHLIIQPNLLSEQDDVKTMLRGIKFLYKLENTKIFQKYGARIVRFDLSDCKEYKFKTDEFWRCHLRNFVRTVYHPVGTAKMGPKSDKEAVVSPTLKVYGVENLRVIDASIMPTIVSGNTNAATIAIAEKGSELIINEWFSETHTEL